MKGFAVVQFFQYEGQFGSTKLFSTYEEAYEHMEREYLESIEDEPDDHSIEKYSAWVDFYEPVIWWEIHEVELPGGENA